MGLQLNTRLSTHGGPIFRAFDLYADFDVENFTASNTDVLGASQGVQSGSLTVVDTGAGTVKVVSNELELVGNGVSSAATCLFGGAITKALGKAFFYTQDAGGNINTRFGLDSAAATTAIPDKYSVYRKTVNTYAFGVNGGTEVAVADITATQDYQLLLLLGGNDSNEVAWRTGQVESSFLYGARLLIKGGAFTTWTLLDIEPLGNTATLYPILNVLTVQTTTFDNILIPTNVLNVDAMFDPAYFSASPDEADHDTGVSDFVMEVIFTTPGAGTDPLDIRYRKAGTNDHWLVRVTPGTAGTDIEIIEDNSGEVQRASADIDWVGTTEYRVAIHVRGDNEQRVYVDGALKMTYTTTNTFNETETVIDLLKNSFTVDMIAVHNKTDSSWDAEISTATGGVY